LSEAVKVVLMVVPPVDRSGDVQRRRRNRVIGTFIATVLIFHHGNTGSRKVGFRKSFPQWAAEHALTPGSYIGHHLAVPGAFVGDGSFWTLNIEPC